jgi:hypothetical protein
MDKRKAYAIAYPVRDDEELREGHRRRVEHRFATALFCDGEVWCARVEYLDYNFRRQRLGQMPPGSEARMAEVAERLLVACDCGDGQITLAYSGLYALEAKRAMMPSEQRAVGSVGCCSAS